MAPTVRCACDPWTSQAGMRGALAILGPAWTLDHNAAQGLLKPSKRPTPSTLTHAVSTNGIITTFFDCHDTAEALHKVVPD
jgi:hypothetical protein